MADGGVTDLAALAASFGHVLHAAGLPVTPERSGRFARVLQLSRPATEGDLYWCARVTLVSDHDQLPVFDRAFAHVFGGLADVADQRGDTSAPPPAHTSPGTDRAPASASPPGERRAGTMPFPSAAGAGTGRDDDGTESIVAAVSDEERLRTTAFAALSAEERATLHQLLARLDLVAPVRRSRRTHRHPSGRSIDVRATLRRAHRTGGDPARTVRRRRRERPRRVVLLCDVSGSMEATSRAYLQLLHGAVRRLDAEAFVFATRLTCVTRALRAGRADAALAAAARAAPDWSGGTRIGDALAAFNDTWGRRGLARGAVVVIVSDGWESRSPELVGEQMARLARLAHRIVWVNPRKAAAGYQPLVGGMAAAMAHVDEFVSGHSLAALDEVLAAIAR